MVDTEDKPWVMAACLDDAAKCLWKWVVSLKFAIFLVGGVTLFVPSLANIAACVALGLAVMAEVVSWRMDCLRGLAQRVRRKLEYLHGLGWNISKQEIADLSAGLSKSLEKRCSKYSGNGSYFASQGAHGPNRLLENTIESAWWSKHLSGNMFGICLVAVIATAIVSIGTLSAAILAQLDQATLTATSRIVISILMLVISIGLVKLMLGYSSFQRAAQQAEELSVQRLGPDAEEREAIKVLTDYQIARAGSPPIPTCVWKHFRDKLNREWNDYRQGLIEDERLS